MTSQYKPYKHFVDLVKGFDSGILRKILFLFFIYQVKNTQVNL